MEHNIKVQRALYQFIKSLDVIISGSTVGIGVFNLLHNSSVYCIICYFSPCHILINFVIKWNLGENQFTEDNGNLQR